MPRTKLIPVSENIQAAYIYCPGCMIHHSLRVTKPFPSEDKESYWAFNGNVERPTFSPSLLCNKDHPESRCHCFITNGRIHFLSDCYHGLKGQIVDLPEIDL